MAVNGFLVDDEVQKYNYESLENYNTPDFSTSSTYQVGDYVMYQGKLYRCTTEITTSGGWDSSKWSLAILSDDVANLRSSVESGEYGLSEPVKQAILQIARKVVYIDDQGQTYYDDLYDALYPLNVVSITARYTQSGTVYDTDTLDSLKDDLVVTAVYSDSSTQTVAAEDYTLSGELTEGASTITVSYGGKTTTFAVTVTENPVPAEYQRVEYIESDGNQVIFTDKKISSSADYAKIECGIYKATQASASEIAISCGAANKIYFDLYYYSIENYLGTSANGYTSVRNPMVYGNVCDVVLELNTQSPYATLTVTANGQTETATKTTENFSGFNNGHISFFAFTDDGVRALYHASCRLYYVNVFDVTGEIIHAIPCYRKSDGVIGLYDTVSNTFLTNGGTGTFTKGADVS